MFGTQMLEDGASLFQHRTRITAVSRQRVDHAVGVNQASQSRQTPIDAQMHVSLPPEGKNQALALDNIAKARQLHNKPFRHGAN